MKNLKNASGFTLVELMVVVSIIGILSAVAIPNFKKYQAKAKTSEAKLQLASVYSAETAAVSDFDYYVSCLNNAGYDPSNESASRYYGVGFSAMGAGDSDANDNGFNDCAAATAVTGGTASTASHFYFGGEKKVAGRQVNTLAQLATTTAQAGSGTNTAANIVAADGSGFIAVAGGPISADAPAARLYDLWSIDENKRLVHEITGY